jgi:Wadjet protein JetA
LSLFDVIPREFFRLLSTKGADIYLQALLALLDAQRFTPFLPRDVVIQHISDALEVPDAIARTSDVLEEVVAEFPANEEEASSRQSHASRILLYFMKTYWLREEPAADFSRNYTIPHYAQRLLDILHEIGTGETLPIRGFICSIRDLLRAAETEGNIEVRLPEAFRQTQQLRSGLSQLQDRMREHIRQIAQEERASKALAQLSSYHAEISDLAYHQLKTTDHVSRFRPQIIEATAKLEDVERLLRGAESLFTHKEAQTISDALSMLTHQVQFIHDQFEVLDKRLSALDALNGHYIETLVRTVERDVYASSTISGRLYTILTTLFRPEDMAFDGERPEAAELSIDLFTFSTIDTSSLATPREAPQPFVPDISHTSARVEPHEFETNPDLLNQIKVAHAASRPQIRQFARNLLQGRNELHAAELPVTDLTVDLPRLILLWAYGDGSLGYQVQEIPEAAWIERVESGIGFRDFLICKH